ncbi:MAG TPA: hypothetical protein VMM93_09795, partial [Vicinamibacterales bacterium]|nr:hypothetical protein [Vicinamibacterales bacterium]
MTRLLLAGTLAIGLSGVGVALQTAEPVDAATNAKIRDEGLNRSQVGEVFSHFVDVIGPRLAGSPAYTRSAEYARDRLKAWGLANPRLEPFEFSRGWTLEQFTLEMVEPRYMPLIGYPEAWSASTSGEMVVSAVSIAGRTADAVEAMRGQLAGAAVLSQPIVGNFIRADRAQPTD